MNDYGRRPIGVIDACPICGARIQATEEIRIAYDYLTLTLREEGGPGLDDIDHDERGEQETVDLRVYCWNDHSAEEMEIEYRKKNDLPRMGRRG